MYTEAEIKEEGLDDFRVFLRVLQRTEKKMLAEYPELKQELRSLDRARRASQRSDTRGNSILEQLN